MYARSPEEIHALIQAAVNTGDLDAFLALHEEGATTIVPTDGRAVTGVEQIRAALAPIFVARPTVEIEFVAKLESGDLALTHARVHVVGTRAGESLDLRGRGTVVSRRQSDDSWRIVLDNPMSPG